MQSTTDHIVAAAIQIIYPMDVIGWPGWYNTLPSKLHATPDTVMVGGSPDLMTYFDEWFHLNSTKDGVVFKARTNGAHTEHSRNPRSELREMSFDGKTKAAWSAGVGKHSMEIEQMITAVPIGSKPVVVVGQIHDEPDDVVVWRYEGDLIDRTVGQLWITDGDTTHGHLVDAKLKLNTRFSVGFDVVDGKIGFTYNGQMVAGYTQAKKNPGCYFKAGAYNQSGGNVTLLPDGPDKGQADYAEVVIYNLQVCHNGVCRGNAPGRAQPTNPPVVVPPVIVPIITKADLAKALDALNMANKKYQEGLTILTAALKSA